MALKPFIAAGVALTSAALIVAGTPTLLSAGDTKIAASAPSPTKLSNAKYELTTLASLLSLSPADYQDAYYNGYGGWVPANNPYFPYSASDYPITVDGLGGVGYLVADNLLWDGVSTDPTLVNYYYELGAGPAIQIAAQQVGLGPVVDAINLAYSAPAIIVNAAATAVQPIPGLSELATSYINGFDGGNVGIPGIIAYSVNDTIGRLPTFDLSNPIGFFVGDGADADAATCGTNCNGGNAGILWGNGGDGANGGSGGNAGFFVGNGGNGSDGVDAVYNATTGLQTVLAGNGGNGGWGGLLAGNGGNAGNGGDDINPTTGEAEGGDASAVGGDGGIGGQGGIFTGNGGKGGAGGAASTVNGDAYGGFGGSGGRGGFSGDGADGGAGGKAVAITPDDEGVAVGGDGGQGGNTFSGTGGKGGAGGNATVTAPDPTNIGTPTGGTGGAGGVSGPGGTPGAAGADGTETKVTPPAAAKAKSAAKSSASSSSAAGPKHAKPTKKVKASSD
ncbi:MAG: hypothetical protein ABWY93_21495 [Mycobacterium sp.]